MRPMLGDGQKQQGQRVVETLRVYARDVEVCLDVVAPTLPEMQQKGRALF